MSIRNRADIREKKWLVMCRIFHAWLDLPELRLGQMLSAACDASGNGKKVDIFDVEDFTLAERAEMLAEEWGAKKP